MASELDIATIRDRFFPNGRWLDVSVGHAVVPLVAARLARSTRTYSEGQKVYVYGGFYGENERLEVVGRYRRKHRFVLGVCAREVLVDRRVVVVHEPAVVRALAGRRITLATLIGERM